MLKELKTRDMRCQKLSTRTFLQTLERPSVKLTSTCSLLTLLRSETIEFLSNSSQRPSPSTSDPRICAKTKVKLEVSLYETTSKELTKKTKLKRHKIYLAQHDPTSWLILESADNTQTFVPCFCRLNFLSPQSLEGLRVDRGFERTRDCWRTVGHCGLITSFPL